MSKKTNSNPASEEKAQAASAAEKTEEAAQQTEAEAAKQSEEKKPEEAKQQEASEFEKAQQALAQETQDAAFKKGVEMTMNQLVSVMEKLGVVSFGAAGEVFDPQLHNAVMHVEDEALGENVIAEVFQKGFKVGDKVVRFAMVKVAN